MAEEIHIDLFVEIERAVSLEALGLLVHEAINRAAKAGRRVVSISHAVDHEDAEGKQFSAPIATETR